MKGLQDRGEGGLISLRRFWKKNILEEYEVQEFINATKQSLRKQLLKGTSL